jgi:hypothetical protein
VKIRRKKGKQGKQSKNILVLKNILLFYKFETLGRDGGPAA